MLRAEIAAEVAKRPDVKEEELSDIEADDFHSLDEDVVVVDHLIDNVWSLQENTGVAQQKITPTQEQRLHSVLLRMFSRQNHCAQKSLYCIYIRPMDAHPKSTQD